MTENAEENGEEPASAGDDTQYHANLKLVLEALALQEKTQNPYKVSLTIDGTTLERLFKTFKLNEKSVGRAMDRVGVPRDFSATVGFTLDEGIKDLGAEITAPDKMDGSAARDNKISVKLTTFNYDYTSSAVSMFTDGQFDSYSALPMGGSIGLPNHNGESWLGGLIESALNGLYPPAGEDADDETYRTNSMRLKITQYTDYTDKNATLVTKQKRGTVLQITRDASRHPHSLRATMFDVLTDYTESPGLLEVGKDAVAIYEEGWAAVPGMLKDVAQLVAGQINKVSAFYIDGDIRLYIQFYISIFGIESLTWNPGIETPSLYTLDISELVSGKIKNEYDEPEEIESDEETVTADDIEAAKEHPVTGITLNLGYGLIDDTTGDIMDRDQQDSKALGIEEPQTVSNLRIDLDALVVREILKILNSMVMKIGKVPATVPSRATYGTYQAIMNMLENWIKGMIKNISESTVARVIGRVAAKAASALLDNVLGDQIIHVLAKLLPFVEPSKGDTCYFMVEFDTNKPSFSDDKVLIRKILFRASCRRTGEYSQLILTNAGIRLGVVDGTRAEIDFDGETERTLTDVFNIDLDGNGVADYLQDLPKTAKVYYEKDTTSANDEQDEVSIIWTDSTFVIDPTGGKTATISRPTDGSDTVAITYNIIGSMLNYNKYVPLNIPYSAIRLVKYANVAGKTTPLIKGEKIELPMRITPDMVKKLDTYLPNVVMVYLTDGYGENGMYYTFDGREEGGNVVRWDYSGVSDSYDGGEYVIKLTFGDGNTKNYHIEVPVEVIPQKLSAINGFTYSEGENKDKIIAGNSLTYEAGATPTLPDRVYAEFGTLGSKLYEIHWAEDQFTSKYAGATYYVDAYIGNTEIGYHLYENIPIVFKSKVIAGYKLIDENSGDATQEGYDLVFDPYDISEADGKPKSLSLHSYPRVVYLAFEGDTDQDGNLVYVPCYVEWNLDNVVNHYTGNSNSYAIFRYGDEKIGYQYVKVFVTIKEMVFTASMLYQNELNIITDVDPMYLYVDNDKKENRVIVAGINANGQYYKDSKGRVLEFDPVKQKYPDTVTVHYGAGEDEYHTFTGDDVKWDTSDIVVRYDAGVRYAKLRVGNEAAGYQIINIPITIEDRSITAVDLSMIRDKYEFDPYLEDVVADKWYPTNAYGAEKKAIVVFSSQEPKAYPITWDLSRVNQDYKGGTSMAYARVGSDEAGWQMVPFTVVVKERVIDKMQIEAFVFDPYDSSVNPLLVDDEDSPYPTSAIAVFKDDSTHRFSNLKWDISEIYKIWNYKGGECSVVVKFGNEYGGYQTYNVPVKVERREIYSVDINEGNVIVFDPYGGIDPRLEENYYKKLNVTFTSAEPGVPGEKGVVDVIWDLGEVINNYVGYKSSGLANPLYADYAVSIRVGNSICGYQNIGGITVRILNREIVGSSMSTQKIDVYSDKDLASTVTVTFSDGTQRTMPVTWINENFRTDINAPDFPNWNEEAGIDDQEIEGFTADARIGDSIGGYQIVHNVPVRVYKRIAKALYIDNVLWSKADSADLEIDYTKHYFTFDPYDGKMDLPSTVQIYFDDGTDTYMKAVWDLSNIKMDLTGGVYGGYNSETTGAILRLGNARTGHIEIEFMVVVKNREVAKSDPMGTGNKEDLIPSIYSSYDPDTDTGELLSSIVNDPYLGSGFPNTIWIKFKESGIPMITWSEPMEKIVGNWNIEYTKDASGNKIPVRASIKLGSAKAGYETYYFDVTTVYRQITVPSDQVVTVDPYQVGLDATLTVNVCGAVKYNATTGKYEALPVSVCGCTCQSCLEAGYCGTVDPVAGVLTASCTCECRCKGQTMTMKTDWSKSTIHYDYPVYHPELCDPISGEYVELVDVYVGNQTCGYQKCSVKVVVLNKRVQSISVEEFEIDPYDYSTLPASTNVTFMDDTSGELPLSANIASAIKDPSNTNTGFYMGGKYTVTAYLGDRIGGYQAFPITLNVKDRTIEKIEIDGVVVSGEEDSALEIKPYGDEGLTKRPDKAVTAHFTDGSTAELKALWNSINIDYTYQGAEQKGLVLLVGNAEGGYQKIFLNVRMLKAAAVSAKGKEGYLYNTFLERSGLPDEIVVTFSEDSYVETLTLAVAEWGEKGTIDDASRIYRTTAKIGDALVGYQWVPVELDLAEIELRKVVGTTYTIDGYDELSYHTDGRLRTANGNFFTVTGQIGDDLYQSLYVKLLETPSYTYQGDTLILAIEVGNALTGYFSETSSGEKLYLTLKVNAEVVTALIAPDGKTELTEYLTGRKLDPYAMPDIRTGGKIAALIEGGAVVELPIYSVTYKKESETDYKTYVSYEGGSYLMRVEVGNEKRGLQVKEYAITIAEKTLASVLDLGDMRVDPYTYRLPSEVTVTFTDGGQATLPVTYRKGNVEGAVFGNSDFKYSGGSFDVVAIIDPESAGGKQVYGFKLEVKQMYYSKLHTGVQISIDQVDLDLNLPESIELEMKSGEIVVATTQNGLIDNGDWMITVKDGKYMLTLPEGGDPGSWDFSEVDLGYEGGNYFATYKYGNAAAGYQMIRIPVVVSEKVIDFDKLQYIVTTVAGTVTLESFGNPREIEAAVGEYFDLPTELWVVFKDGGRMAQTVEWDGSDVDLTKPGRYAITTTIFEQTITVYLTLTEKRKVVGDDVSDVYVAARGGSYELPTTIRQNIYVRASSGSYYPSETPASERKITWRNKPSSAVEDMYVIVGTVSNGTFSWERTIKLYVYSTYVNYIDSLDASSALGTAAGENVVTVEVGSTISAADLPEVNVVVYDGEAALVKKTAAVWYYDTPEDGLSLVDTNMAGSVYVLTGIIKNRAGEAITYKNGEPLRFTIKVNENVDLKTRYEVGDNAFTYGETSHVRVTPDPDVKITSIVYKKDGVVVAGVSYDAAGEPVGEDTYPRDAGEYIAYVTLSGFGKVETVEVPYHVIKKVISAEEIVVIGLKARYTGDKEYTVSYGSRYNVPLVATYEIAEGATGTLQDGIPYSKGRYKVTIVVDSMNYELSEPVVVYLNVVEYSST